MDRYFLEIAFQGTHYHGWQKQQGDSTVQETIERALATLLNKPCATIGCGRTDTGVHAQQFYLHLNQEIKTPEKLVHQLNSLLPSDIAAKRCIPVAAQAHARFDAIQRTYQYRIHFHKDPFLDPFSHHVQARHFQAEAMIEAATFLLNVTDFHSLCRLNHDAKTTLCQIFASHWEPVQDGWIYTITANRFLRSMVRLIVGAMIAIAREKLSLNEFRKVILSKERFPYLKPAPPHGLSLVSIRYPYI